MTDLLASVQYGYLFFLMWQPRPPRPEPPQETAIRNAILMLTAEAGQPIDEIAIQWRKESLS